MRNTLFCALICSTFLSTAAFAGMDEALKAFNRQEYESAFSEFSYLAAENNDAALYYLGRMYDEGLGVQKNPEKAFELFQQAARAYNAAATAQIGKKLVFGEGVTANPAAGLEYLKNAARAGSEEAFFVLGNLYAEGLEGVVPRDYSYAFGYYLLGSLKGDKKCQYILGFYYFDGRGTPQNYESSFKWLNRSANQGYVLAQLKLAELHASTRFYNSGSAYAWYSIIAAYNTDEVGREAARNRDIMATKPRKKGEETLVELQKKITNWRPVKAEQSVPEKERRETPLPVIPGFNDAETIQKTLAQGGVLLTDGDAYGVTSQQINNAIATQDWQGIEQLIEASAAAGKTEAYAYYGDLMQARAGDDAKAFAWYSKGANAGESYAQYQLAKMLCEGRGTPNPDAVQCYSWLLIANKSAQPVLKTAVQAALIAVEAEATPEELEQGRKSADAYTKPQQQPKGKAAGSFNFF